MNYETLYAFSIATAVLALSPGPDNMYVLTQSLVNGKKYGLATTAGLISGCLVHTTLLAFGVSVIIRQSEALFLGLKIGGAAYLFYLAYMVYRSDSALVVSSNDSGHRRGLFSSFKQGFIMNVLNPKVTIFFMAFFPGFLFSDTLSPVGQFYILGLIFMFVSSLIFCGIAILSGSLSAYLVSSKLIGPVLKWVQVIVFVAIAVYLLLSGK